MFSKTCSEIDTQTNADICPDVKADTYSDKQVTWCSYMCSDRWTDMQTDILLHMDLYISVF